MSDTLESMELDAVPLVSYRLRYRTQAGEEREVRVNAEGVARPAEAALELGLTTVRGTEKRRVVVCPQVSVTMLSCEAHVDLDLKGADALFLSGYNSWTDSWEHPVNARMYGLTRVPRKVVEHWVLDGNGDYRFVPEDATPGHMHGFGYGYVRYGDDVLLVGSLNERNGFTVIYEVLEQNLLRLDKEVPQRQLAEGERCELMSFALVEGKLDDAVARWCDLAGIKPRPAAPLVGFSSWYRYYQDISEERLAQDLVAVKELLAENELGSCTSVFQIDDGYVQIGDWLDVKQDRFPAGMGAFATRIAEAGLLPGLWMAPFVCETESRVFAEHPDWLLRDETGELVCAGVNWSGYYPLDTRNPEVREYVRAALWTATHEWGYRLLKLDFLFGACMLPHDGLNRGELMADALDLLRSSVPEGVVFDLCGVPVASALGQTEYCRIGPDVGLDWDDVPWMRLLHRERVSTKNSLGNTRGRAHLDGKAFRNDPDVFFLRRDVKLTKRQRSKLIGADAALGGMFLTSDDVGAWDKGQRLAFARALAVFVNRAGQEGSCLWERG